LAPSTPAVRTVRVPTAAAGSSTVVFSNGIDTASPTVRVVTAEVLVGEVVVEVVATEIGVVGGAVEVPVRVDVGEATDISESEVLVVPQAPSASALTLAALIKANT
jgi:hypothetical protein